MKTLKKLAFIALTIVLVSCGSDDSSPSLDLTNENIVGTYNMTSFEFTNESEISVAGVSTPITSIEATGSTFQVNTVFNDDGTFILSGEFLLTTESDLLDDDTTEIIDLDGATGTYALDADNNDITLSFNLLDDLGINLDGIYDIDTFSASELEISKKDEESVESTNLGVTTTTTNSTTIEISFEK